MKNAAIYAILLLLAGNVHGYTPKTINEIYAGRNDKCCCISQKEKLHDATWVVISGSRRLVPMGTCSYVIYSGFYARESAYCYKPYWCAWYDE